MQSIYVGNLNWSMTSEQLQELFEKVGTVSSSRVITDRETGRSRGFGFVEMSKEDANKAVTELDDQEIEGRSLRVNLAEDKRKSTGGGGGYNRSNNSDSYQKSNSDNSYGETEYTSSFESKPRSKKSWGSGKY